MPTHAGPHGEAPGSVKKQKQAWGGGGRWGEPKPDPLLGFLLGRQGVQFRIS